MVFFAFTAKSNVSVFAYIYCLICLKCVNVYFQGMNHFEMVICQNHMLKLRAINFHQFNDRIGACIECNFPLIKLHQLQFLIITKKYINTMKSRKEINMHLFIPLNVFFLNLFAAAHVRFGFLLKIFYQLKYTTKPTKELIQQKTKLKFDYFSFFTYAIIRNIMIMHFCVHFIGRKGSRYR